MTLRKVVRNVQLFSNKTEEKNYKQYLRKTINYFVTLKVFTVSFFSVVSMINFFFKPIVLFLPGLEFLRLQNFHGKHR